MSSRVRCVDPSREDMLAFLVERYAAIEGEDSEFDREEAIYWFASDWSDGQWSSLYAALCASPFRPGILSDGCEPDSLAEDMYGALVGEYING